jgi:threonine dehydratase
MTASSMALMLSLGGWWTLPPAHTGTFKARGAFNRIISASDEGSLDPSVGVVVVSGGKRRAYECVRTSSAGHPCDGLRPPKTPGP